VYGEHQNVGDRYRNVVGIFMNQIMQGLPMTVFGDGQQSRAFTYIGDVAPRIAACVTVDGARNEVFNIGAEVPTSVLQLARVVAAAFGVQPCIRHLEARKEVLHAFSCSEKLQRVFGKQDYVPLSEGVARMAAWARSVGPRKTATFDGVEVLKNMPPAWQAEFAQRP
jgi:UDP-glucose 4-epimerase